MATSAASVDVRASVVSRLLGIDITDAEELAEELQPEQGEPLTVSRIAEGALDGARRRTAAESRTQQFVAGVAFEHTTIEASRVRLEVDGDRASVTVESFRFERTSLVAFAAGNVQETDPLVVDLDGDGIETSGIGTARFDLDGDGHAEQASLAAGGDALLALDRDGDGRITSGRELFGDHHGRADGIAELASFDDDEDGDIDAGDRVWRDLRLFRAPDQPLLTLAAAGIERIDLTRFGVGGRTAAGDRLTDGVTVWRNDGTSTTAVDALLRHT